MPHTCSEGSQFVLAALIFTLFVCLATGSPNAFTFVKLQEQAPCQPWTVEAQDRCTYVVEHSTSCYPDGGWQTYLRIHFCTFAGYWQYCSLLLLLGVAVLFFGVLLTVSERFFCPAVELISEFLQLPPAVAGATLLAFGNGAPDIFTQVAAVGQGGSAAVGMALAEPLGGGLFTTNIVFGLVVLLASKAANVSIQRWAFLKDVSFYLVSLLIIAGILADHKVALWEAAAMMLVYIAYVCATFYVSRHDEPVHADVMRHEVPQEEGVDVPDSCSEAYSEAPHALADCVDHSTSMHSYYVESPSAAGAAAGPYHYHHHYGNHGSVPSPRSMCSEGTAVSVTCNVPSPVLRSASMARRHTPLTEPLLSPVDEVMLPQSSLRTGATEADAADNAAAVKHDAAAAGNAGAAGPAAAPAAAPAGDGTGAGEKHVSVAVDTDTLPVGPRSTSGPANGLTPRTLKKHRTFTEGVLTVGVPHSSHSPSLASPLVDSLLSPNYRSLSDSGLVSPPAWRSEGSTISPSMLRSPRSHRTSSVTAGRDVFQVASRGESPHLQPLMQQLQEHHVAEQQELLQKQYEEHLALVELHEEAQEAADKAAKSWATMTKHKLEHPLMLVLSCTMPRVGTGHGHHYQRWRACLLPITAPLTLFLAAPDLFDAVGTTGVLYSLACAAVGAALIYTMYPSSNVPRRALKGVFAVMSFLQSICWMNIAASSLVHVFVLLGVIVGVKPALLGATVLAYGNSVPDLMNNLALTQDGFPSMAVAACFAGPLFTLLVGIGSAMAYGAVLNHGVLHVPVDGPMLIMIGFGVVNLVKYLLLVPLLYGFRMDRKLAFTAFLYYACFNVVYGLAIAGVITIPVPKL